MHNLSQVALPSQHFCLQLTIHLWHGGWCDIFMSLCLPRFCLGSNCRNIDWISFPLQLFSIVWVVYQTDEKFCSKCTWTADFSLHLRGSRDPETSSPGPSALEMLFFVDCLHPIVGKWKQFFFSSFSFLLWIYSALFTVHFTFMPKGNRFEKMKGFQWWWLLQIHNIYSCGYWFKIGHCIRKGITKGQHIRKMGFLNIRRQTLYRFQL